MSLSFTISNNAPKFGELLSTLSMTELPSEDLILEIGHVVDNWEPEDQPVSSTSRAIALRMAALLPTWIMPPTIDVSRYGEVEFEWYKGPFRHCVLIAGTDGILYTSFFDGKYNRRPSAQPFTGEFPRLLLDHLRALGFDRNVREISNAA